MVFLERLINVISKKAFYNYSQASFETDIHQNISVIK